MQAALLASMVERSPDAFVVLEPEGRVAFWNPAAESIFGWTAPEATGQPLGDLIFPPELADDDARMRAEAMAGDSVRYEALRRRRDGVPIYVNATMRALRDPQGGAAQLLVQMSDATRPRVRRDADLVQARFHGLLEFAPDAIVIVNGTGRIVLFNAQARTLFGYDGDAVIGEPIEMLLPQRLREAHVRHRVGYLAAARMRPMGLGLELHGRRRDGATFPVEISLSPIETEAGRMVMSAIRDISERKRIERVLQEKNLELERASQAKDRFLASMSHELRTPLNAIIGFTGLLLMKVPGPLTADQEKQLRMVQSSGNHLLSLINDLLDLARIESGNVQLRLEPVDVAALVDEVVTTLRPAAQARGLVVETALPQPGVRVRADRRALQQVLINLVNNAIKFTPAGRVMVSAQPCAAPRGGVELAVQDTGVGISAQDLARLFGAFVQVGEASTRRIEGTGLGLHLSGKLAAMMGSRIEVQSEPGQGSRFSLVLEAGG